jgi:hypothetical protein
MGALICAVSSAGLDFIRTQPLTLAITNGRRELTCPTMTLPAAGRPELPSNRGVFALSADRGRTGVRRWVRPEVRS